ncbi:hypothetical protein RvY_11957 [Ramazzottius varieornatus]|uniref:BRCT domain-containing protein n=1 Tax=Ramazzottius varieornatus TaxID=947166 RepID=A0A1D1VM57_RAMVA|nr:hypothetical protein RvY_11957 [Ramazzottius varieornatus]
MDDMDVPQNGRHDDTMEAAEEETSRHSGTASGDGKPYRTGMCVREVVIVETFRRETRTKEYYEDGKLMFASKPAVNEESQDDKKTSHNVSAISTAKFQTAKAETGGVGTLSDEKKTGSADAQKNGRINGPEQSKSPIAPYVFAKYSDNVYYLAQVLPKSDSHSGTVTVKFSDSNDELKVKEASVLQPKEWLQPGRAVLVRDKRRDDVEMDFEEAVIKRVIREEGKPPRYAVRLVSEGEDTKVTREVAISEIGIEENEVWKHQDGNQEPKSEVTKMKKEDGRNTETPPTDRGTAKKTNGARCDRGKSTTTSAAAHKMKKSTDARTSRDTRSPSALSSAVEEDRKTFRIGKIQYHKDEHVFSKWAMDDRWYAGIIEGVERSRFQVKWCETGAIDKVVPDLIVRAKDVLVKGAPIHTFSEGKQFYDDGHVESYSENGQHLCVDKRGVVKPKPFEVMMMENNDIKLAKKLAKELGGSSKDPKSTSAAKEPKSATATSTRERTTEKSATRQSRSVKRPRSPTPESIPPSRSARKSMKRDADAETGLTSPAEATSGRPPLRNCSFIVTNGSSDPSFIRDDLVEMIDMLGGAVLAEFDSLAECGGNKFLVAPNCCRTAKYLQCLAANFPCVSHKWILDTNEAQETGSDTPSFEKYRLPAGKAAGEIEKDQLVKWKPRKILLDNFRVGLLGKPSFVKVWSSTFRAGKAAEPVIIEGNMLDGEDLPSLECIMSETAEFPALLRRAAVQKDIPIVTVEWIIQTLIHGEKQAFDEYLYEELE